MVLLLKIKYFQVDDVYLSFDLLNVIIEIRLKNENYTRTIINGARVPENVLKTNQ